jgi:O-antigen ligase
VIIRKTIQLFISISIVYFIVFYYSIFALGHGNWILAIFASFVGILYAFKNNLVDKSFFYTGVVSFLWLPFSLLAYLTLEDSREHFDFVLLHVLLNFISIGFAYFIFIVKERGDIFFYAFAIWICINFLVFILYLNGLVVYRGGFFSGIYMDRNHYAIQSVLLLVLSFSFTKKKLANLLLTILAVITIIFSESFTGLLMLITFSLYITIKEKSLLVLTLLVVSSFVVILWLYLAVDTFTLKIDSILAAFSGQHIEDGSIYTRVWLISNAVGHWIDNFWFGVGLNNSRYYLIPNVERFFNLNQGLNAHNNYIETLLNQGFFGFLVHYGILLYVYIYSKFNKYKVIIRGLILLYLVAGIGSVTNHIFILSFVYTMAVFLFYKGKFTLYKY